MFGALNRFISRLDAAPEEQQSATNGAYGFQVLRNANADVPLEPWFDFVIGINGRTIVSLIQISGFVNTDPRRKVRIPTCSRLKCETVLGQP